MSNKYSINNFDAEHMARALGNSLPISTKHSIEICSFIRNKSLNEAKKILSLVAEHKKTIPFRRFNKGIGHKKITGPGRYPEKASKEIIKLLESVEANAQFKGLNTSNLIISHICAHISSKTWHYGRKRRRKAKRTNIEIVVMEAKKISDKKASTNKPKAKEDKK